MECRICGCTEDDACLVDGEACCWVEPNLCSACVGEADAQDAAFFAEDLGQEPAEPGFRRDGRSGLWLPETMV